MSSPQPVALNKFALRHSGPVLCNFSFLWNRVIGHRKKAKEHSNDPKFVVLSFVKGSELNFVVEVATWPILTFFFLQRIFITDHWQTNNRSAGSNNYNGNANDRVRRRRASAATTDSAKATMIDCSDDDGNHNHGDGDWHWLRPTVRRQRRSPTTSDSDSSADDRQRQETTAVTNDSGDN